MFSEYRLLQDMSRKRRGSGTGREASESEEYAGHAQTNSTNMHEASLMGSNFFGNSA